MMRANRQISSQSLVRLAGHTASIRAVRWSPGGELLASAAVDGNLCLWDDTGERVAMLQDSSDASGLAWSPDGRLLASASAKGIRVWSIASQSAERVLEGHKVPVH